MATEQVEPVKGDWVQVWAQIWRTPDMEGVHPEDYEVELASHNQNFYAPVRLDHVVFTRELPDFAQRCPHMWHSDDTGNQYVRCTKHTGHGGKHRCETPTVTHTWPSKDSDGYFEEG